MLATHAGRSVSGTVAPAAVQNDGPSPVIMREPAPPPSEYGRKNSAARPQTFSSFAGGRTNDDPVVSDNRGMAAPAAVQNDAMMVLEAALPPPEDAQTKTAAQSQPLSSFAGGRTNDDPGGRAQEDILVTDSGRGSLWQDDAAALQFMNSRASQQLAEAHSVNFLRTTPELAVGRPTATAFNSSEYKLPRISIESLAGGRPRAGSRPPGFSNMFARKETAQYGGVCFQCGSRFLDDSLFCQRCGCKRVAQDIFVAGMCRDELQTLKDNLVEMHRAFDQMQLQCQGVYDKMMQSFLALQEDCNIQRKDLSSACQGMCDKMMQSISALQEDCNNHRRELLSARQEIRLENENTAKQAKNDDRLLAEDVQSILGSLAEHKKDRQQGLAELKMASIEPLRQELHELRLSVVAKQEATKVDELFRDAQANTVSSCGELRREIQSATTSVEERLVGMMQTMEQNSAKAESSLRQELAELQKELRGESNRLRNVDFATLRSECETATADCRSLEKRFIEAEARINEQLKKWPKDVSDLMGRLDYISLEARSHAQSMMSDYDQRVHAVECRLLSMFDAAGQDAAWMPTRRVEWLIRSVSKTLLPATILAGAPVGNQSWLSPKFKVAGVQDVQLELQVIHNGHHWENCGLSMSLWASSGLYLVFKLFAGDTSTELRHTFESNSPSATMHLCSLGELRNAADDSLRCGVEIIEAVRIQERSGVSVAIPRPAQSGDGRQLGEIHGSILEHCYINRGCMDQGFRTIALISRPPGP